MEIRDGHLAENGGLRWDQVEKGNFEWLREDDLFSVE